MTALDEGVRQWFQSRMSARLGTAWTDSLASLLDLSTEEGRANLFLKRKEVADPPLCKAVQFVLQGDSNMGLAAMHQSWSKTGFGKWAHIHPGIGLRIATLAKQRLAEFASPPTFTGPSHHLQTARGPGTETPYRSHPSEGPHSPLENHVGSDDPSTTGWIRRHGMQCLAHVEGGTDDGYTYSIGPMTPERLLICLNVQSWRGRSSCPRGWRWMRGCREARGRRSSHGALSSPSSIGFCI